MDEEEKKILDAEPDNNIVEIDSDPTEDDLYESSIEENIEPEKPIKTKKKRKIKLPKWKNMNKKQKIIFIVSISIIILLIIFLIYHFCLKKEAKQPDVVITENNYRYENGKLIFLDQDGKELGDYECTNKDEKLCFVAYYTPEENLDVDKYVDKDNNEYKMRSSIYKNNYVFVFDNSNEKENNLKLYNLKTKSTENNYIEIKKVNDEYVIAQDTNKKFGLIDFKDDSLDKTIAFEYEYLGFNNDKIVYEKDSLYGITDNNNSSIVSKLKYKIKSFNTKYIVLDTGSKYLLYDYNGNLINFPNSNFIAFYSDYIVSIYNNKLTMYTANLEKINYDEVIINSTDYLNTNIVDNDGKITETKKAFNISQDKDIISIKNDEDNGIEININESRINETMDYASYSNDTLYFFSDADKTKSIGSYKCSNSNTLNSSVNEYDTCFIAKESKLLTRGNSSSDAGYLPIYNRRFVFINDGGSIILYDLNKSENKATYSEVDAGFYNNQNIVNLVESSNPTIVAKHNDGLYGVITLTNLDAKGIVPFKCNSIKYLGNNFVCKYNDGTYHLFSSSGTDLTSNFTTQNEITDYNGTYVVVKDNDNNYTIDNINTGKSASNEFKYISLASDYFVGIDKDYKLNLYEYGTNLTLLCDSLKITKTDDLSNSYQLKYTSKNNITVIVDGKTYIYNGSCE
jgi:hypothetical protein